MREVQAGYESCADEYQVKIKSLRSDTGVDQDSNEENGEDVNLQLLCCSFQVKLQNYKLKNKKKIKFKKIKKNRLIFG